MKQQRDRNEFKMTAVKMANAHMESFFHTMKTERIRGRTFATFAELEAAPTASIRFYTTACRSTTGYASKAVAPGLRFGP
jgi:transposase InsO family protein